MSSACAQIGAWGQVNKMEEVEVVCGGRGCVGGVGGEESTALDRVKIVVRGR